MSARTGKHGAIELHRYEAIHETTLARFADDGFIIDDGLAFESIEANVIVLSGALRCRGGIELDVTKGLAVLDGAGRTALVQTEWYSYDAHLHRIGNILRYDSPHDDHHTDHHVHRFDVLSGDRSGACTLHGDAGWPTLGEVIAELREWYWTNQDALETLRRAG